LLCVQPVAGLQLSVVQMLPSSQLIAVLEQVPFELHVSVVQALLSLQQEASLLQLKVFEHTPPLQVSVVQILVSAHLVLSSTQLVPLHVWQPVQLPQMIVPPQPSEMVPQACPTGQVASVQHSPLKQVWVASSQQFPGRFGLKQKVEPPAQVPHFPAPVLPVLSPMQKPVSQQLLPGGKLHPVFGFCVHVWALVSLSDTTAPPKTAAPPPIRPLKKVRLLAPVASFLANSSNFFPSTAGCPPVRPMAARVIGHHG
jgi:hypothetical protein